ncbi:MAG: DUF3052 domain-containing protein [Henriciella sp.]
MAIPAGYSGKPLYQKLGMKAGMTCLVIRGPAEYGSLIAGADGVRIIQRAAPADLVHVFCARRKDIAPLFARAIKSVKPGGMIWMSWPKKSCPLFYDLTEQDLRDHILRTGWVDVKVCAVDSDWSGLKFLKRKT